MSGCITLTFLCGVALSSLIADRSACEENSYLEMVLDKAIELAPSLLPTQLDYLTLIFLYKHVKFEDISTLEDLQNLYNEIQRYFRVPRSINNIPYFDMLGILTLRIGEVSEILGNLYGFKPEDVAQHLPPEQNIIPADYGLTPVGIVLAIFNAHSKGRWEFDLSMWIHE